MKYIMPIAVVASALALAGCNTTQERIGGAGVGAVAGAAVAGPVGAAVGGVAGAATGPTVAHRTGISQHRRVVHKKSYRKTRSQ